MNMLKRYALLFGSFFLLTLPMAGYAAEKRVLNVYNWDDYIDEQTIPEFEKAFNVKVNYDVYDSNETLLAKLQAGATGFDVIFPSDYMVEIMIKLGLLEPLDKSKISNCATLDPAFLNQPFDPGNQYSLPFAFGTVGIGYRSDKITKPVDSWKVLFDPQYEGRIVMLDDVRETLGVALKLVGGSINTKNPDELEKAKEMILKQKPLVKAYLAGQAEQLLLSGDAWLVHNWSGDIYRAAAENPAIAYVIPEEGSTKFLDNFAIPVSAQNKELAHQFINFLLQPEVDARIHNKVYFLSTNKAAFPLLDPALRATLETLSPELLGKLEFVQDLGKETRFWDKIWTEIKTQ
ncbi:extracellular solute-binding protein, family 1 [Candidatus Moduliflexus flocculans]|uniref:Extracellular solute-binding protein, family 1 n=1 Tax=Candidatus Moduliflexus flocculans TaxID=1499966 RepID=A0A081BR63_9BACT|nr:extracellular solute-binding protein, family 1 [Candidatus Moduliflexus flocculans]